LLAIFGLERLSTMSVYLFATLDTKGIEAGFIRDQLAAMGIDVRVVDAGCMGEPQIKPDITRDMLYHHAETTPAQLSQKADRGQAVTMAARAAGRLARAEFDAQRLTGILAIGGSAGTTIGTAAMRELPLGIPKVMVSTLASGDVRPFVGFRDVVMINSVVDIAGINRITRRVFTEAAAAMAGLIRFGTHDDHPSDRPIVAATMFGVTTPCVEHARRTLEQHGYEVLVFHATGSGGQAMEGLIRDGLVVGVLDITTTELADELVGGVLSAGPTRLTAAGELGIPQVVSVGATDMVNFWAMETVPQQFRGRKLHKHNENVTLMRTSSVECDQIGRTIAQRLSRGIGRRAIILPRGGVSALDRTGQPFDDPGARKSLFDAIRSNLGESVELIELDSHINDPQFASAAVQKLILMLEHLPDSRAVPS
jgi:uncharacterized protein (UPF0261 family)